jgi:hypothetical protein
MAPMMETSVTELDGLRRRLTDDQRAILNATWEHYRDRGEWIPCRVLHHQFGKAAVLACLGQLGANVIWQVEEDVEEYYRLTFLGVLLTDQGEKSEQLLAGYLEYVRKRYEDNPRLEWVGSQEVEAALNLTADRSYLLRQLIRLSHWWGGGSGFGDQEWAVGVPIDVDEIPLGADLRGYIRQHVLTHFRPPMSAAPPATPRQEFWFIEDPALQRQLATDWREAQDVYQVRGWKSCVILCGGILETMLLTVLAQEGHTPAEPEVQPLPALVEAARARGILVAGTPLLDPALREFRNLIHPGLRSGQRVEVTRDEAESALTAVRTCLRQIATKQSSQAGQN